MLKRCSLGRSDRGGEVIGLARWNEDGESKMQSMKTAAFFLLLMGLVATACCVKPAFMQEANLAPEPSDLTKMEATSSSFPEADIVYLLEEVVKEVSETGESKETARIAFKILTEKGKIYSNCEEGFNSQNESLSLLYARTINPDGSIVSLRKDAIRVDSPYIEETEYSDFKEMHFSMPAIEIGSIVEYLYVKRQAPVIGDSFNDRFQFQGFHPVLLSRYKIIAPESMQIHFHLRNPLDGLNPSPLESSGNGKKTYLWEYENIPPIHHEESMPPAEEIAFQLYATTMYSWEDFAAWWWPQVNRKPDPDPRILEIVAGLTSELPTTEKKIRALFEYVKREIRYVSISLGKCGYIPEAASEVIKNKYGDCKDKSTLLISMLRAAGIPAHYVLIPTASTANLVNEFPYPFQFNHCIVAAETMDGLRFMDPTSTYNRYDYLPVEDQDRGALLIKGGNPVLYRTPLTEGRADGIVSHRQIDIEHDGSAIITESRQFLGSTESFARSVFSETSGAELRKMFEGIAFRNWQGAELVKYSHSDLSDITTDFQAHLTYHSNQYFARAGDMIILPNLGENRMCFSSGTAKRKHPIILEGVSFKRDEVTVNIPPGILVHFLPESVDVDTPFLEYRSKYQQHGDVISHVNEFVYKVRRIPAEDYSTYRQACRTIREQANQRVLLKRKQ